MRNWMAFAVLMVGASLTACASGSGGAPIATEIAVTDAPGALTSGATDTLFTLTLVRAGRSLPLTDIGVAVEPSLYGAGKWVVTFSPNDANGNGELDPGEGLSCAEPGANMFDASYVGSDLVVSLMQRDGPTTWFEAANAIWTPAD